MDLGPLSETAVLLANHVAPPSHAYAGVVPQGLVAFLTVLFTNERHSEQEELLDFLTRCAGAGQSAWESDPWFDTWVEIAHEYVWTSPEGCSAVGFTTRPSLG